MLANGRAMPVAPGMEAQLGLRGARQAAALRTLVDEDRSPLLARAPCRNAGAEDVEAVGRQPEDLRASFKLPTRTGQTLRALRHRTEMAPFRAVGDADSPVAV
jgi:hypothetical protein